MSLSSALWRPTSSRSSRSSPVGVNRPGRVEPAGPLERRLGGAQTVRQRRGSPRAHHRARRQRLAADRDLVERGLAADPARRRRDEVPLGDERRVERARQAHERPVVRLGMSRRVAGRRPHAPRALDQPLGRAGTRPPAPSSWPGVRIVTATSTGLLPRAGRPDLERLLAHHAGRRVRSTVDPRTATISTPEVRRSGPSSTRMAPQSIPAS